MTDEFIDTFDPEKVRLRTRVFQNEMKEIRTLHAEWFPVSYNDAFYDGLMDPSTVVTVVADTTLAEGQTAILSIATIAINRREKQYNAREDLLVALGLDSYSTNIAYILTLGVVDELRRKGLGKRVLEKAIEEVVKRDPYCQIIMLHVIEYNTSAGKLYRELGFLEFKIEPNFYFFADQWYNGILFYKKLNRPFKNWYECWR